MNRVILYQISWRRNAICYHWHVYLVTCVVHLENNLTLSSLFFIGSHAVLLFSIIHKLQMFRVLEKKEASEDIFSKKNFVKSSFAHELLKEEN